jgi:2-oxoglutarate ferredoxin oxidoreductase subunit alpha
MVELPLVIINVQRGGPSTGLPTKTEQSDLLQVMFGRNGDSPVPVISASTPSDCFSMFVEAVRIATKYMTPVFFLSDGYIANGSEPWKLPEMSTLNKIDIKHPTTSEGPFMPFTRDAKTLARPWAVPGTPGLEHRIGGIEKADGSGAVSYDPANHQKMTELRRDKVRGIANDIPLAEVFGDNTGRLLVLGWGSPYGTIRAAVEEMQADGHKVSHCHLNYINPFPRNLGEILKGFDTVLIPEINMGQLIVLIRAEFEGIKTVGYNRVTGQPFKIREIKQQIGALL